MRLYLLRHAETEWNREDRIQGRMDSPITERGYDAIRKVRNGLADLPIEICFSSDLKRAKKTAECLLNGRNLSIIEVEALRELPLGDWEGRRFQEIQSDPRLEIYFKEPEKFHLPGCEDFHDLYKGLRRFIAELEQSHYEHVLIVAHGVSIRALLNILEGVAISDFWHRPVAENMKLSLATFEGGRWQVLRRGDKQDGLSY